MTAGYEGLTPKAFLNLLQRCDVERVVDVRELATSRRIGFSKTALIAALTKNSISYTHLAGLGCPRAIRHDYREDFNWQRYTKRFCTYLKTRDEDLQQLAALVRSERCCLLCFEEDFNFCHRTFVADRLGLFVDRLRISHLTGPILGRVVDPAALAAA